MRRCLVKRQSNEPSEHATNRVDANPRARSGSPWPEPVDEPPAGQHRQRVENQERRVHQSHVLGSDPILRNDPLGSGDGYSHAVEVRARDDEHQKRHGPSNGWRGGRRAGHDRGSQVTRAESLSRPRHAEMHKNVFEQTAPFRVGFKCHSRIDRAAVKHPPAPGCAASRSSPRQPELPGPSRSERCAGNSPKERRLPHSSNRQTLPPAA